jgi:antitoxin component YwqK of YwqJK toxin-antitoxin module
MRSVTFFNGRSEGVATAWHPNGNKASEAGYAGGELEGRWTSWHAGGQLESRGDYHYGRRVGKWSFWSPEGVLDPEQSGMFREGEKEVP